MSEMQKESLISPLFIFACPELKDKYYQAFKLFTNRKSVKKYIKALRKHRGIVPDDIKSRLNEYINILKNIAKARKELERYIGKKKIFVKDNSVKYFKIVEDSDWAKLRKKADIYWTGLEKYIAKKITIEDIRRTLKIFNKPFSWKDALSWYILTGETITPSVKYNMFAGKERIILEIFPEATARDLREAFKEIKKLQLNLQGYGIKEKRVKKKLNEHLSATKDKKKYKYRKIKPEKEFDEYLRKYIPISKRVIKAKERFRLVEKYNPKAVNSEREQKREEARQRQIYHRYKKYA